LEKRADAAYASLLPQEQTVAKRIFLELTQIGDRLDTRRRISLGDLVNSHHSLEILDTVTQRLANDKNRLITRTEIEEEISPLSDNSLQSEIGSPQSKIPNLKSKIQIDVVHEALIRHWKLLGDWKQEYQTPMVIERKIEEAAQEWEEKGKKSEYLLQESRLATAEEYLKSFGNLGMLDGSAEAFIAESRAFQAKRQQEEEARKQQELKNLQEKQLAEEKARKEAEERVKEQAASNQKLRQRAKFLWLLSGGITLVGLVAVYVSFDANQQKTIAQVKEQAANVQTELAVETNVHPLILALATTGNNQKRINESWVFRLTDWAKGFKAGTGLIRETQDGLFNAVETVHERNLFKGHENAVISVAFSP
ncbi:MAG: hypothetical protein ACKO5Q_25185, partial [Microcystaceae cyanobacterium]